MSHKNRIQNARNQLPEITNFNRITGVLLGLLNAIVIYSLFNVTREMIRLLSVTPNGDIWPLDEDTRYFYNLFFAYISFIFGQSVCFSFWFQQPRRLFGRRNLYRTTILNDQRILTWSFLEWFTKLGLSIGLFFAVGIQAGFAGFHLYPGFNSIFFLLVFILFFQQWNTIRLTYKSKSLNWFLFSVVLISSLSFGLATLNLIDYKTAENKLKTTNIYERYKLNLPEFDQHERSDYYKPSEAIYVVQAPENLENNEPTLIYHQHELTLTELKRQLAENRTNLND